MTLSERMEQMDHIMRTDYKHNTGLAAAAQTLIWGCEDEGERVELLSQLLRDLGTLPLEGSKSELGLSPDILKHLTESSSTGMLASAAVSEMGNARTSKEVAECILRFASVIKEAPERVFYLYQVLDDPRSPIPFHDMDASNAPELSEECVEAIFKKSGPGIRKLALMARAFLRRYKTPMAGGWEIVDILEGLPTREEKAVAIAKMLSEVHEEWMRKESDIMLRLGGSMFRMLLNRSGRQPTSDCESCRFTMCPLHPSSGKKSGVSRKVVAPAEGVPPAWSDEQEGQDG